MRKENLFAGIFFIVIGCALLIANYVFNINIFHFGSGDFWPFIVLAVGVIFEMSYFTSRRAPGLLVPGGIITVCSLLFMFEVATKWDFSEYTWPVYILAVTFGLFQLYAFGSRSKGLFLTVMILTAVTALSAVLVILQGLSNWADFGSVAIAAILIIFGLIVLFGRKNKGRT
ncbi:MAG: hypothetical protein Q8920_01220 [Bacillota bacterium]|nr:hypothetical protein [Bacillota bacterium]